MYPLVFFAFALIAGTGDYLIHKNKKNRTSVVETYLLYLIVFCIGFQGLFAAMGHTFFANQVAEQIGWPTGSPFQFEVAMANLALGVAGIAAFFWRKLFWVATVLIYLVFLYGDFVGHLVQMSHGDHSPYNSGIFLWVGDLIIPTIILIFTILYFKEIHQKP